MSIEKMMFSTELMDNLREPIFIKKNGEDGLFLYCNQAFLDFFGISRSQIINSQASQFLPKNLADFLCETDKALTNTAQLTEDESTGVIKNKSQITLRKSLIFNNDRDVEGFIGIIETDLTHPPKDNNCKGMGNLSKREAEVLVHLAEGKSVKTIAGLLNLSRHTVTDHVKSIYLKLGVHSKTEAACKLLANPTTKHMG